MLKITMSGAHLLQAHPVLNKEPILGGGGGGGGCVWGNNHDETIFNTSPLHYKHICVLRDCNMPPPLKRNGSHPDVVQYASLQVPTFTNSSIPDETLYVHVRTDISLKEQGKLKQWEGHH